MPNKPPLRPNACLQVRSHAHGQRIPDWRGRVHVIAASDPVVFAFDKYIEEKTFLGHSVYCVESLGYEWVSNATGPALSAAEAASGCDTAGRWAARRTACFQLQGDSGKSVASSRLSMAACSSMTTG
jgi:hypothetical protein